MTRRPYTPGAHQQVMIEHAFEHPRCAFGFSVWVLDCKQRVIDYVHWRTNYPR